MKKIISLILIVIMYLSLLTCCVPTESGDSHTLYIRVDSLTDEMTATFINTENDNEEKVVMKKTEEGEDYRVFSCKGNTRKYNMVYMTYNGRDTNEVAFNKFVNGWYISTHGLIPYTQGAEIIDRPEFTTEHFEFKGYDKEVYIWTPDGYDAESEEKYSTIYLLDGQWMLVRDFENAMSNGCWNVAECITSMMAESDNKAIAVAIATPEATRYSEMTPKIAGQKPTDEYFYTESFYGNEFCEFINNEIVPFIEKNYNVYTDADHTSVAGSSLGGLESLYIGLEHPETFGTVGAMSPTLVAFNQDTWLEYLGEKDFEKSPCIYFYSGSMTDDNGAVTQAANKLLLKIGYPDDKLYYHYNPNGIHRVNYWRSVFPEFLVAMFEREALIIGH